MIFHQILYYTAIVWWISKTCYFCHLLLSVPVNDGMNSTMMTPLAWDSLAKDSCERYNGTMVGTGCDTPHYEADVFMFSCLLFIGTFLLSMSLKMFRNTRFFPNMVYARRCIFNYLLMVANWFNSDLFSCGMTNGLGGSVVLPLIQRVRGSSPTSPCYF